METRLFKPIIFLTFQGHQMADYDRIVARMPEVSEFLRARGKIGLRGDVMAYAPGLRCESFTTDAAGFRHSTFQGKELSVRECLGSERYGMVLGASETFGFGIAGNQNTIASLLAQRLGYPFANAAMPGANSRNLHSLLLASLTRTKRPPAVVIHSSGADLANFCASSIADPVYGSPNHFQRQRPLTRRRDAGDSEQYLPAMLAFTSLWTAAIADVCRSFGVPLILLNQTTFFEKAKPSRRDIEFRLGKASRHWQAKPLENHKKFNAAFGARRKEVADRLNIPLAGWGLDRELGFIDELHFDRAGTELLAEVVGDAADSQMRAKSFA